MEPLAGFFAWLVGWLGGHAADVVVLRGERQAAQLEGCVFSGSLFAARRALRRGGKVPSDDDAYRLATMVHEFANAAATPPRPDGSIAGGEALSVSLRRVVAEHFATLNDLPAPSGGSQAQGLGIGAEQFADDFTFGFTAAVQRAPALTELAQRLGDVVAMRLVDLEEQVEVRLLLKQDVDAALAQAQALQVRLSAAGDGVDRFVTALEQATGRLDALAAATPAAESASPASYASAGTVPPRLPGALPPVFNVPARSRSPFVGREEDLAELEGRLAAAGRAGPVAVTGVGGVGKTRLVLEYVYGQLARFDVVWWVRGEEPITLLGDVAALAEAPGLPDPPVGLEHNETDAAVTAARGWLERHDRWLLLVDNVEDPSLLRELLPRGGGGQVILTSRADVGWAGVAGTLPLQSLDERAAARLLTDRSGHPDLASAQRLACRLGGLPLALEQAAAYAAETGMSLAGYLQLFDSRSMELFERGRPADRTDTIATTWSLTLDRLTNSAPVAVALLQLTSFMDSEGFPVTLLQAHADLLDDSLAAVADPIVLADALLALRRHGLIVVDADMVTVHRVLQDVVRHGLARDEQRSMAGMAVEVLAAAFPAGVLDDAASWAIARILLPHVLAATSHTGNLEIAAPASCWLLDRAGTLLQAAGQYRDAVPLFERAIDIGEDALGADHPRILEIHNNYGLLLWKLGRLPAARDHLEQALATNSRDQRLDPISFATTASNLGMVLLDMGMPTEARRQLERSFRIVRSVCGPGSPEGVKVSSNLASALKELGELSGRRQNYSDVIRGAGCFGCVSLCTMLASVEGGRMPRNSPYQIVLSDQERDELEARARRYTSSYAQVVRAKIVLMAAEGLRNDQIAARLDTPRQVVSKWRKRFYEQRLAGLDDLPRVGRPPAFPPRRGRGDQGARV